MGRAYADYLSEIPAAAGRGGLGTSPSNNTWYDGVKDLPESGPIVPLNGVDVTLLHADVEQAISGAAARYFDDCRDAIPGFIDRHFNYPGAIALNRVALGWDMLRAPINLFWAPIYSLIAILRYGLAKSTHLAGLCRLLDRVPAGFSTAVQTHISELIQRELLNKHQQDNLLESYMLTALQDVYQRHSQAKFPEQQFAQHIEPLVADALQQYQYTRTASADITNSLSCTILGAFAFQKFTPGGIGIAALLASVVSTELASQQFWFGETIGRWYYSVFPPEPSMALSLGVFAGVLAALASFAALSGVITDPVQALTGLHRRRLLKMLNHLQQDFTLSTRGSFRPKDHFVARVLDGFDMIRASVL